MVKISNRLKTAASLVGRGKVLADVGTDHAYIPIYLIGQGKIPRAIAMDINRGPLERADRHIAQFGMGDYIETRLSDGLEALAAGEAQSILIAGMGGGLVIHILEEGKAAAQAAEELILQPQSEIERVRKYLEAEGYVTETEDMVFEDGKYYPMMRVRYEAGNHGREDGAELRELGYRYGLGLLKGRNAVLQEYLKKERHTYEKIYETLKGQPPSDAIALRKSQVEKTLQQNQKALAYYQAP